MRKLTLLPLLCLFLTVSAPSQESGFPSDISQLADERILDYRSDITVHADGSMDVRETIQVRARGEQIKRGIYREFPTRYRDHLGNPYRVGFDVVEVLRDGRPDAWHTKDRDNGVAVYIGKEEVLLQPGEYTYTLAYRTTRQIGFFDDHDELYWNVTGNGWGFFIDQASATVTLPRSVSGNRVRLEAYTGPQGAQGKDFTSDVDLDGRSTFRTTKGLEPYEGLTIVVSFPKGMVKEPMQEEKIRYFVADNRPALVGALGLFILLAYYMVVWAQVGRDPEAGTLMPLYEPPQNFSPAAIRYLTQMSFDDKTFAAAVLDMAVKGHITISEESGTFTVSRKTDKMAILAPDERVVSSKLLGNGRSIELKTENHAAIRGALQALENALKLSQEKIYFLSNRRYLIPGFVLSVLVLIAMVASIGSPGEMVGAGFMTVWLSGWTAGVFFLLRQVLSLWKMALFGGGGLERVGRFGGALFLSLFALPFLGGEVAGLYFFSTVATPGAAVMLLVMVGVNILFHYLLKAPTSAGRRVLDQIEGFKMFLSAVEGDRMRMLGAVEKTPQLFEKYLPYALALGVEHEWAEQFADVFARAAQTPGGEGYSPAWYSGSNWNRLSAAGFASSFGSSFSSAVSSSSTPPGSRSGSSSGGGGGGSSGGGGGGGGGGGW
ncbi:MAG: DUF2207 domain-containing protein [Terriglobales bacterium]